MALTAAVSKELSQLEIKDLKELKAKIDFWINNKAKRASYTDSEMAAVVYDCLRLVLKQQGNNSFPPYNVFQKNKYYSHYVESMPIIEEFFSEYFPKIKKVEKLKLCTIFLSKLISILRAQKLPVTVGVLAVNIHRLPEAVEASFPGYAESGLLPKLLEKRSKKS